MLIECDFLANQHMRKIRAPVCDFLTVSEGYVLTQTLKSGVRLCTAYNLSNCYVDPDKCEGRHLCSVVLQSGRACGGKHPAKECRGKRALTTARFQQMQLGPMPTVAAPTGSDPEGESTTDESDSSEMSFTQLQLR